MGEMSRNNQEFSVHTLAVGLFVLFKRLNKTVNIPNISETPKVS